VHPPKFATTDQNSPSPVSPGRETCGPTICERIVGNPYLEITSEWLVTREQSLELPLSLLKKIASTCRHLMLGPTKGSHSAVTDALSLKPKRRIESVLSSPKICDAWVSIVEIRDHPSSFQSDAQHRGIAFHAALHSTRRE
jgi:hypothetical protein